MGVKVYYMDTDSLITNKPLPDFMVDSTANLNQNTKSGIPKVYGLKLHDGTEIVKGLSQTYRLVPLNLYYRKIVLNQIKSFRNVTDSTINLVNQTYELIPTENKRYIVYGKNGVMTGTKPYVITP